MTRLAKTLFGSITTAHATGDHSPNPEALHGEFIRQDGDQAVIHFFCRGCGRHFQVTIDRYHELVGPIALPDADRYYVEVAGCSCCDGEPKIGIVKEKPRH